MKSLCQQLDHENEFGDDSISSNQRKWHSTKKTNNLDENVIHELFR